VQVEFVQVPAQPVDLAGVLADEGFAVVAQQADLAVGAVEPGGGQVGLAQHRAGNGQRVDRVGLAERARGVADVGHQLRRHSGDPLTGGEQVALEVARQVPQSSTAHCRSSPNWSAQRSSAR
jgi:hypothetical protein